MRFNKAGASVARDDEAGEVLDDVARIRPAVDRLRRLLASATILDLKASAGGYWADRAADGRPALSSEPAG
jgi:hypothetical protein